jgi:2-phospho-L-lactate guanylyltransferase
VTGQGRIWAVVPIKEMAIAKQRLSGVLSPQQRRALAYCMAEDVLSVLAGVRALAGVIVSTADPDAIGLAHRYSARVNTDGARDGHSGAVMAVARTLAQEGSMLTVPGDVPRITTREVQSVLDAHRGAPSFTIVPSHDELGSNAVLMSPPAAVALRFSDNSFRQHLDLARQHGIEPTVLRLPGIGMDVDNPADLAGLLRMGLPANSRTRAMLERAGLLSLDLAENG